MAKMIKKYHKLLYLKTFIIEEFELYNLYKDDDRVILLFYNTCVWGIM